MERIEGKLPLIDLSPLERKEATVRMLYVVAELLKRSEAMIKPVETGYATELGSQKDEVEDLIQYLEGS